MAGQGHRTCGLLVAGLVGLAQGPDSEMVPARAVGSSQFKPIDDAPGSYVKIRSSGAPMQRQSSVKPAA